MISARMKRDLFGGALRRAGLASVAMVTSSALAEFSPAPIPYGYDWLPNQTHFVASGLPGNPTAYNYTYAAAFPSPVSYNGSGLSASSYSSQTLMGASLNLSDGTIWTSASVRNIQWFTVDDLFKEGVLEWDFTAASNATLYIYHVHYGYSTPIAIEGTSGSFDITFLLPGEEYILYCTIEMEGVEGNAYGRLVNVPAPGAIAVLGVGALIARRRRRE